MYPELKKQSGASIVAAIFLIVILALMAAGMVSLLATSQQSISQEVTSAKSYMAGRSCLHWAMYQLVYFENGAITTDPAGVYNTTFNDVSSNLYNSKCETTIELISTIPDNPNDRKFYNINVIAEYGNTSSPEYSKRSMQLQYQLQQP